MYFHVPWWKKRNFCYLHNVCDMWPLCIYAYQFWTRNGRKIEVLRKLAELGPVGGSCLQARVHRLKNTKNPPQSRVQVLQGLHM